jgi:hypothetical protein
MILQDMGDHRATSSRRASRRAPLRSVAAIGGVSHQLGGELRDALFRPGAGGVPASRKEGIGRARYGPARCIHFGGLPGGSPTPRLDGRLIWLSY